MYEKENSCLNCSFGKPAYGETWCEKKGLSKIDSPGINICPMWAQARTCIQCSHCRLGNDYKYRCYDGVLNGMESDSFIPTPLTSSCEAWTSAIRKSFKKAKNINNKE